MYRFLDICCRQCDRPEGKLTFELFRKRPSIHAGHVQIDSHQTDVSTPDLLQGLFAVRGVENVEFFDRLAGKVLNHPSRLFTIVDNQQRS